MKRPEWNYSLNDIQELIGLNRNVDPDKKIAVGILSAIGIAVYLVGFLLYLVFHILALITYFIGKIADVLFNLTIGKVIGFLVLAYIIVALLSNL